MALGNRKCSVCDRKGFEIFKNLDSIQVEALCSISSCKDYSANEVIALLENGRESLVFICKGSIKYNISLNKMDSRPLWIAPPGNVSGLVQWNKGDILNLVAYTDTCVIRVDREFFNILIDKSPMIGHRIIDILSKNLHISLTRIFYLLSCSVKQNMVHSLLFLAESFGSPSTIGIKINLKLDRTTLAKMCGTVPETLARIFKELEEEKAVFREGRHLHIVSKEKLLSYLKT